MALSRMFPLLLLAGCAASGAARGCAAGCRGGSGLARSAHGLEEVALHLPRAAPGARSLAAPGRLGEVGAHGAHGAGALDHAVAALPELEGPASALAKVPASSGAVLARRPGVRSLADDYARAIDAIGVTREQHVSLLDVLDVAQSMVDVVAPDDPQASGDPLEDDRITLAAYELEARMKQVLDEAQLQKLYAALGPPRVMAYRLKQERPLQRPAR